jgi:dihydroorotase
VAGLADGTLDAVASDHTPWTYEEKTLPFSQAPAGAVSLELVLPLLWRHVESGALGAVRAWQSLTTGPEGAIGCPPSGALVLFDPHAAWTVEAATLKSRSSATAWLGKPMQGKVLEVFPPQP